MKIEYELNVVATFTQDTYDLTCTTCGLALLSASTPDKTDRKKAIDLAMRIASGHLCPGKPSKGAKQ